MAETNYQPTAQNKAEFKYSVLQEMNFAKTYRQKLKIMAKILPTLQTFLPAGVYNSLIALYYDNNYGNYLPIANPLTLDTTNYPTKVGNFTRQNFVPFGNNYPYVSQQDIAIVVDLQLRVWLLEQMLQGNTQNNYQKDINVV